MKILFALNALGIGAEPGRGVEIAREQGLTVIGPGDLSDEYDVALVQDAAVAYEVAELYPRLLPGDRGRRLRRSRRGGNRRGGALPRPEGIRPLDGPVNAISSSSITGPTSTRSS
jgi:hypothetical protein